MKRDIDGISRYLCTDFLFPQKPLILKITSFIIEMVIFISGSVDKGVRKMTIEEHCVAVEQNLKRLCGERGDLLEK